MSEAQSNEVILEKIESLRELTDLKFENTLKKMEEGFKGTHDRQDKTNGNVIKNTEFRQEVTGVINMFKWIGFANIVLIIFLLGGGLAIKMGYFNNSNISDSNLDQRISDIINKELKQYEN